MGSASKMKTLAPLSRRTLVAGLGTSFFTASILGDIAAAHGDEQNLTGNPVHFYVGLGAGSGPDVVCRRISSSLSRLWNAKAVVHNQSGATGGIAMATVGAAAPDGHTLLFAMSSTFVALPEIQTSFPYDLARDFVPVGFVGEVPMVIAASPSLGVDTLADFIRVARRQKLNVAVTNRGGTPHLTAEWLGMAAKADLTSISYRSTPEGLADLLGGRVQAAVDSLPGLRGAIEAGRVKVLAVCSQERLPEFPNIPTAAETLPGFVAVGWFAIMAPPHTPDGVAQKLSETLQVALQEPDLRHELRGIGFYPRAMSPAELRDFIAREKAVWKPVIERVAFAN
ncbi:MAG TPA: tripartite tricarboxylate transporter substrate binding protein [Pseudolabrys sp.]|nr:tripartite tricarboxylate transporter substrate binding protein [Pseudolabrys sp.]